MMMFDMPDLRAATWWAAYEMRKMVRALQDTEWDKPQPHGPVVVKNGIYVCALCSQNINGPGCRNG